VRAQVLDAAARLLFGDGMAALTFERVAAASGASKTTLYKWWPSPGALAAEAYFAGVEHDLEFGDTGDIERDLRAQLRSFAKVTSSPAGRALRELIGAAQGDPALLHAFAAAYSQPRRQAAVVAMRAAQQRGQLRADAPLEVLVDQLWGACYHRLLLFGEPIDDRLIDQLLDNVLRGAAAN
jgi:AcrR family transcriptional regulator